MTTHSGTRRARSWRRTAAASVAGAVLVAVAAPAFAPREVAAKPVSSYEEANAKAQTLVVASEAERSDDLRAESYAATTPEEIQQRRAAEAEQAQRDAVKLRKRTEAPDATVFANLQIPAPNTGAVRFPLSGYSYIGEGFGERGGAHDGVDVVAPALTEIYAAADGVVSVSDESYYGYGVAVEIQHVIDGQPTSTTYGHMTHGTRAVQVGDTVKAGQLIGLVGTTGRSTGDHLHFEVRVNASLVDPLEFLRRHGAFAG